MTLIQGLALTLAGAFQKVFVASFLSGEKGHARLKLQENVDEIHLGLRG